jgi:hypothetical protein
LYELRNGTREHFRHHARTVHFDSLLAGAQLRSNLLVQSATNDPRHYFPFAWCKRLETTMNEAANLGLRAVFLIAPKRLLDCGKQPKIVDGLGQKIDGALLHRGNAHADVTDSGQENDGERILGSDQCMLQLEASQPRHANVEQ